MSKKWPYMIITSCAKFGFILWTVRMGARGVATDFWVGGSNRRQGGQSTPKYHKKSEKTPYFSFHFILESSHFILESGGVETPGFQKCGGQDPPPPPRPPRRRRPWWAPRANVKSFLRFSLIFAVLGQKWRSRSFQMCKITSFWDSTHHNYPAL